MSNVIHPVVNINGSSAESLLSDLRAAINACDKLDAALRVAMPHGRDYPRGNYAEARIQHAARIERVAMIKDELMEIALKL